MLDVTNLNFSIMNTELRVVLIDSFMNDAIESDWDESDRLSGIQAIVRVPNGESVADSGDEDLLDEEVSDAVLVARMIANYFGNL